MVNVVERGLIELKAQLLILNGQGLGERIKGIPLKWLFCEDAQWRILVEGRDRHFLKIHLYWEIKVTPCFIVVDS